jgi:hypothetical protein
MLKDQKDLLSVFNARGVEYVIVGGYAVAAYGFSRATKDLDVLIRATPENAEKVFRALAEFGAPMSDYTVNDFYGNPASFVQFGLPPNRIDILQSIEGVDEEQIWPTQQRLPVDAELHANFLSLENLIQNKQHVGRLSDKADVDELKKVNHL